MKFNKWVFHRNNDFLGKLVSTLQDIGIDASIEEFTNEELLRRVNNERRTLHFVWGGTVRRISSDRQESSPNIIWCEQAYGLSHYDSVSFDAKGQGRHCSACYRCPRVSDSILGQFQEWVKKFYPTPKLERGVLADIYKTYQIPSEPFWLVPLQIDQDTTMIYDADPFFQRYDKYLSELSKCLPIGHKLVVKRHPRYLTGIPNHNPDKVTLLDLIPEDKNAQLNQFLLENCEGVLAVNSSFIIEALHLNKPVTAFGKGCFTGNIVVKELEKVCNDAFINVKTNTENNLHFIADLTINRQLNYEEMSDQERVRQVFTYLNRIYRGLWEGDIASHFAET